MDPFTYGELITIELALQEKLKDMDLSMRVGQFYIALIGKCEQQMGAIERNENKQAIPFADPNGNGK